MNKEYKLIQLITVVGVLSLCSFLFFCSSSVSASFYPDSSFLLNLQESMSTYSLQITQNTTQSKIQPLNDLEKKRINNNQSADNNENLIPSPRTTLLQTGISAVLVLVLIGFILFGQARLKKEIKRRQIVEQQLKESQRLLDEQTQKRTTELENANKEAQQEMVQKLELEKQFSRIQKMKTIGLLAGGIAHKLNNVLTSIISYPDLILMKLPKEDGLRELVKEIKAAGRRAEEVMADLLNITGGTVHNRTVASLNNLIIEYINSSEHDELIKNHPDISFKTKLAHDLPDIFCSLDHIKKCLLNLVNNAADAIETEGNVLISTTILEGHKARQKNPAFEDKDYIVMSIQDSRPEIDNQHLEHIFEPFYMRKVMGKRTSSGLELTIAWNIVHDHNGEITISSSKDGTIFTIYLPSSKEENGSN